MNTDSRERQVPSRRLETEPQGAPAVTLHLTQEDFL